MKTDSFFAAPPDAGDEIARLIETLFATEQRLVELTAGEVDAVAGKDGRTFLLQRAQEQLRRSEAGKQAAILNALPAHIALLDSQGVIVSVNEAWRRYGRSNQSQSPGHGLGLNYLDVCDRAQGPSSAEAHTVAAGIRAVLDGRTKSYSTEYPCHSPSKQRWFLLTVTPLAEGELRGAVVMHLNITERKLAEEATRESEERFSGAFEHAPIGVALVAPDGRWLRVNRAVCDLVGYSQAELLIRTFQDLTHPDDLATDLEQVRRLLAGEITSYGLEKRYLHARGHVVNVLLNVSLVRDGAGQPRYFISQLQDITHRREAESRLRFNEQRYRSLVEATTAIVWDTPASGEFEVDQPKWSAFTGQSFEELRGWGWLNAVHPEDREETTRAWTTAVASRSVYETEHRLISRDKTYRDMTVRAVPVLAENGAIFQWIGVHTDVTERKRTERALRESETHFRFLNELSDATRTLSDASQIMAVMSRMLGRHLQASRCAYAEVSKDGEQFTILHDYTRGCESTVGSYRLSRFGEKTAATLRAGGTLIIHDVGSELTSTEGAAMFDAIGIQAIVTCPLVKDGKLCAMMAVHQTTPRHWSPAEIAIVQDVVERCWAMIERRIAEEGLRQSEILRRIAGRTGRLGGWAVDLPQCLLTWSDEVCAIHEVPPGTVPSVEQALAFYTPLSRQRLEAAFEACSRQGTPYDLELELTTAQGKLIWVRAIGEAQRNLAGSITRVQGAFQDITARKRSEQELRTSEKRFKTMFEQAAVGVAQTDASTGRFVQMNHRYCEILGRTHAEITQLTFASLTHAKDLETDVEAMEGLRSGATREYTREKRYVRPDGSEVWVNLTVSAMWAPGETPDYFITIAQDITAQKRIEEQLRQAQKMEAIGQFCSGVAHDFNNILTVIQGYAGLIELKTDLPPKALDHLKQIGLASVRATGLTRQLLTLSRKQVMQLRNLDLNEVVANMTKMLGRILREDVKLSVQSAPRPQVVHADAGMLEQILMNLTVNARDAMPEGGALLIAIEEIEVTELNASAHRHGRPGVFVHLAVTDTGTGIPPEILPKIFEPFFTTKEVGRGTGLGLATVYGIVKQHQGWIDVTSEVGRGTTFHVYLPRVDATASAVDQKTVVPRLVGGTETILLVEDEVPVRQLVDSLLTRQGYTVLTAETGMAALAVWMEHRDKISLLLTDIVMPDGMSGMELGRRLSKERPDLSIIYTSGYSPETAGKNFPLREGDNFLPKPFDAGRLTTTVRASLDARLNRAPVHD